MTTKPNTTQQEAGFALLITLIVVGVVLSVGVSLLDLSIKQVRLSSNAKDSELAFHAANAGLECARYVRQNNQTAMEEGQDINPSCFSANAGNTPADSATPSTIGDGDVYLYEYEFTWGIAEPRCTQVDTVVASSSPFGQGVTTTNMTTLVAGYPNGTDLYCEPGGRCTVISVRGYNKNCSEVGQQGTIQREVLLQF